MDVAPEVEEVICPGDGGSERAWREVAFCILPKCALRSSLFELRNGLLNLDLDIFLPYFIFLSTFVSLWAFVPAIGHQSFIKNKKSKSKLRNLNKICAKVLKMQSKQECNTKIKTKRDEHLAFHAKLINLPHFLKDVMGHGGWVPPCHGKMARCRAWVFAHLPWRSFHFLSWVTQLLHVSVLGGWQKALPTLIWAFPEIGEA